MPQGVYMKTEEHKKHIGESIKKLYARGYINPRLGERGRQDSESARNHKSIARMGEKNPNWGKHPVFTKETRKKWSVGRRGANNPNWRGGVTSLIISIRNSKQTGAWRKSIFEKDDYTCRKCGAKSGLGKTIILNAHHIKSFRDYPDLRFDIDNGITLCQDCHGQETAYRKAEQKESRRTYTGLLDRIAA